jgi:secondary thiamine-phosphate synthase enzyme
VDFAWKTTIADFLFFLFALCYTGLWMTEETLLFSGRFVVGWVQHKIQLPPYTQGIHPITRIVLEAMPEISQIRVGLLHVFLQHTSASLSINENADPDVLIDLDRALDALAPEDYAYQHTIEGSDDMPGHIKASLLGCSLCVPISDGRLCLGTWQGICLCEHRRRAGRRNLVLTMQGD